jgi:hypothetical protein
VSREELMFWYELGFDPLDSRDWPVMSAAACDEDIAAALAWIRK